MAEPAINVESVSKVYRLGEGGRYDRHFSSAVTDVLGAPFRFLRPTGRDDPTHEKSEPKEVQEEFWALRNVSLEVPRGQVLGIIGANGAGKSTLLKILARITPPTSGRITLQGKVGSLLEVGTGFHPELTGRENIYLNGSILGMRRREIERRYEEIVEFSGIEQFIETPVKRYSSGMFVRLAFAVAAHLDPEILLVDEVLSVGDAEFQRRCFKKMEQIAHADGRTIVFVSHALGSVETLCDRVIVIEDGLVVEDGSPEAMSANYMQRVEPVGHEGVAVIPADAERSGSGEIRTTRVSLLNDDGDLIEAIRFGEPFTVVVEAEAAEHVPNAIFMVVVSTPNGGAVLSTRSSDRGAGEWDLERGRVEVRARLEATLLPGEFVIDVAAAHPDGTDIDYLERVIAFTARNEPADGGDDRYPWEGGSVGSVRPDADWNISRASTAKRDQRVTI